MKISNNFLRVVNHYEGFYANPYVCPGGVVTIGIGTTVYPDGKKVRLNDKAVTLEDAYEFLAHDFAHFENIVNRFIKVPLLQNQFDALVSFTYNLGEGALQASTLKELINHGVLNDPNWKNRISAEFLKWVKATVKGKKMILAGLVARRTTESFLFTDNVVKFFN